MVMTKVDLGSPCAGSHAHQHTCSTHLLHTPVPHTCSTYLFHTPALHTCSTHLPLCEQERRPVFRCLPWLPAWSSFTDGLWDERVRQSQPLLPEVAFGQCCIRATERKRWRSPFNGLWSEFKLGWQEPSPVLTPKLKYRKPSVSHIGDLLFLVIVFPSYVHANLFDGFIL